MDINEVTKRMAELMEPIDKQILMCDNKHDLLMIACCMLTTAKDIFDQQIGIEGRKQMFEDYTK